MCLVCHSAAGSCVVIWSSDVLSRHVFEGRGRSDTSRQQKSQELKVELIKLSRKLQLAESLLLSSGAREEGLPEARVLAYRAVRPSLRVVTRRQGDLASTQAGFQPVPRACHNCDHRIAEVWGWLFVLVHVDPQDTMPCDCGRRVSKVDNTLKDRLLAQTCLPFVRLLWQTGCKQRLLRYSHAQYKYTCVASFSLTLGPE